MGFIRTILIFAVVYYLFKFVMKIAFPFIMKALFNKVQQNMSNNMNDNSQQTSQRPEGEVTINKTPNHKQNKDLGGDYVDFEEVEDK